MNKLAIVATAAAFFASGLVIAGHVLAQGYVYPPGGPGYVYPPVRQGYVNPPIGEKGAKWGTQCWIGDMYFGYWGACPKPKAAPKAAKAPKGAPKT
jgi:hypothetical protein